VAVALGLCCNSPMLCRPILCSVLGTLLAAAVLPACGDDESPATGGAGGGGAAVGGSGGGGASASGGQGGAAADTQLRVLLDREAADGPDTVIINAFVVRDDGEALTDQPVEISADGTPLDVAEIEPGVYRAQVTPTAERIELPIRVQLGEITLDRVALVLFEVNDRWAQAEAVPGLVNSPAYEDSPEISPDGQWLIVSSYSPVDLLSCIIPQLEVPPAGNSIPACNTVLGPIDAPERPDLPGKERILSPTEIDHTIPSLGYTAEALQGAPLPPVAAYGFRRQADDSFAEPFVIAYDAGGYTGGPFGFNFVSPPEGNSADVIFAWFDPSSFDTDGDLIRAQLTLGQPNTLGVVSGTFPALQVTPPADKLQQPDFSDLQSNPAVVESGVYFDQHDNNPREFDILFYPGSIDAPLAAQAVVPVSQAGRAEYQPFEFDGQLFYVSEFSQIFSSERINGGDPTSDATWGPEQSELSLFGGEGNVVSIGEPSLATVDGVTWMYFLYGTTTAAGGLDANVGRIRLR
jgi:hypothetical protein